MQILETILGTGMMLVGGPVMADGLNNKEYLPAFIGALALIKGYNILHTALIAHEREGINIDGRYYAIKRSKK